MSLVRMNVTWVVSASAVADSRSAANRPATAARRRRACMSGSPRRRGACSSMRRVRPAMLAPMTRPETPARKLATERSATAVRAGVLIVNLGTPDATDAASVRRYLREFLSDARVIEDQGLLWKFVLNCII